MCIHNDGIPLSVGSVGFTASARAEGQCSMSSTHMFFFYQAVKSPISRLPISVYIPSVLQHINLYTNSSDISDVCPSRHFSFKPVLVFATALCWLKKRKTTVCEGSQLSRLSSSLRLGLGNWTVGLSDLTWYPRVTKYQHDRSSIC